MSIRSKPTLVDAQRLLATVEYKSLQFPIEKAVRLHTVHGFSIRLSAQAVNCSAPALQRALIARQQERPAGRVGRPPRLSEAQSDLLIKKIKERADGCNSIGTAELCKAVR